MLLHRDKLTRLVTADTATFPLPSDTKARLTVKSLEVILLAAPLIVEALPSSATLIAITEAKVSSLTEASDKSVSSTPAFNSPISIFDTVVLSASMLRFSTATSMSISLFAASLATVIALDPALILLNSKFDPVFCLNTPTPAAPSFEALFASGLTVEPVSSQTAAPSVASTQR